jgi:hypothetical protein
MDQAEASALNSKPSRSVMWYQAHQITITLIIAQVGNAMTLWVAKSTQRRSASFGDRVQRWNFGNLRQW